MRWDRFFEDLEDQLDSEWEAERAALDTEAERLRLSRIPIRDRLVALSGGGRSAGVSIECSDGTAVFGRVTRVGLDWFAVSAEAPGSAVVWIVPLATLATMTLAAEEVLSTVRDAHSGSALAQRMSLGFVLRDLVRRRVPLTVMLASGRGLSGTLDRAGADHLDIALHDVGAPRRAAEIRGFRVVPFTAIAAVRVDAVADLV